jgi:hypothetical protein
MKQRSASQSEEDEWALRNSGSANVSSGGNKGGGGSGYWKRQKK